MILIEMLQYDEEPIIYIEFRNGGKEDTPAINLSLIPHEEEEDNIVSSVNDEEDLLYGGDGTIKDISGALKNF